MKLNIVGLVFVFLAFSVVKGMVLSETNDTTFTVPTFDVPDVDFATVGGCGGFTDCVEMLAEVIENIGKGIIFIVLLLFELVTFVFEIFTFLFEIQVSGIDDAPAFVNLLMFTPLLVAVGMIVYLTLRSGKAESA